MLFNSGLIDIYWNDLKWSHGIWSIPLSMILVVYLWRILSCHITVWESSRKNDSATVLDIWLLFYLLICSSPVSPWPQHPSDQAACNKSPDWLSFLEELFYLIRNIWCHRDRVLQTDFSHCLSLDVTFFSTKTDNSIIYFYDVPHHV